ncbi:hypothetical protein D3C87_1814920 [compost metagenome]
MARLVRCQKTDQCSNILARPCNPAGDRNVTRRETDWHFGPVAPAYVRIFVNRRFNFARTHRVDTDAMTPELQRQLLGHGKLPGLRHRIGGSARRVESACAVDGRDDDDGAATCRLQMRHTGMDS